MEAKCYLCDHEFVEGEEPWLIFEQRVCEDGIVESSLADLLCLILNHTLDEQHAHSPYLCDSCNADVMEFESLDRRLKEVHSRILDYYRQNATLNNLCLDSEAIVKPEETNLNLNGEGIYLPENTTMLGDLVVEIRDEEENKSSSFNNLNQFHFAAFDGDNSETSLPSAVLTMTESLDLKVPKDNLCTQNITEEKEDIIIFDIYDNTIQSGEIENALNFQVDSPCSESKVFINDDYTLTPEVSLTDTNDNEPESVKEIHLSINETSSIVDSSPRAVCKKRGVIYLCLLCNVSPQFERTTIGEHLQKFHHIYMCEFCNESFAREQSLKKHCELDHASCDSDDTFHCDICSITFTNSHKFRLHKETHNNYSKNRECQVCLKNYNSKLMLNDHMNTHTGQRPYKCVECSKDFASKYTLQTHMKTHSKRERPYKCDRCDKAFFNQQNLKQHKKLHVPFKAFSCDVCLKTFVTQHSLNVHMIVHSGQKPFICRVCGKAFARRPEIKDHERIHTGEKPFKCDLCPMAFTQRSNLMSHKKSTHFNEKLHRCNQCERSFKRKRLLHYHVLAVHTGERPYKCNICGAGFVYPEHFKKHMLIHSNQKPFACEVCGKKFNSRDNRNAHRFVHSDKKPYECMECGSGFMRKPFLLAHMKRTKHANDTIIVNQPQFSIQQDLPSQEDINDSSNIENNQLIAKVNDTSELIDQIIPNFNIIPDSLAQKSETAEVDAFVESDNLMKHDIDNVKYMEFDDIIEDVGNQTLTWINNKD